MPIQTGAESPAWRRYTQIKKIVRHGQAQAHGLFFDRLFPEATVYQRKKAVELAATAFFQRGRSTVDEFPVLQPSVSFFHPTHHLLITDEARWKQLPEVQQAEFIPVLTIESRSKRARVCLTAEGCVVEFKGLTPKKFDPSNLNPNSNQPENLLALGAAKDEIKGLSLVGALETKLISLGDHSQDLAGYAQVYRAAGFGERFFPWMRMDVDVCIFQLLADLERVPFEQFLHTVGRRLGKQLRRFHKEGYTLHFPFGHTKAPGELFFSDLHLGNLEVHGHILDFEGMASFREIEKYFQEEVLPHPERVINGRGRYLDEAQNNYSFFCRASDIFAFLGGRRGNGAAPSLSTKFLDAKRGAPLQFPSLLAGFVAGYYEATGKTKQGKILTEINELVSGAAGTRFPQLMFGHVYGMLKHFDQELGF